MRVYPSEDNFPETPREAHKFLLHAFYHLRNRESKPYETLDARTKLNELQIELLAEVVK